MFLSQRNAKELKILPELLKIDGCREEELDEIKRCYSFNRRKIKLGLKITAVFEGIHLFKHLGKTSCHIILTNKNTLCQLHAVPQTF